jgi:hypothetical protein
MNGQSEWTPSGNKTAARNIPGSNNIPMKDSPGMLAIMPKTMTIPNEMASKIRDLDSFGFIDHAASH